jgi:hypothetical protein
MAKVMVYIVHDRAVDRAVQDILEDMRIDHYSRFQDALAAQPAPNEDGASPSPHSVTIAVVDDSARRQLLGRLKALQVDSPFTGIRAFVVSVLDTV